MKRKKKKKIKNKKIVRPISPLEKLNRLRDGSFVSEEVPPFVGLTKPNEFSTLDGSIIPSNTPYHIFYDGVDKSEFYRTGRRYTNNSQPILRLKGETSFGQYKRLKGVLGTQNYFVPIVFEPKKKDFKRGFAYRFFARKRYGDKKVIEISETDFKNNSPMYTTIQTRWFVGDNKLNNELKNPKLVEKLVKEGFQELENLNPMEGYTGPDDKLKSLNTLKDLQSQTKVTKKNKKKFSKGTKKRKRNRSTETQTTQAPSNTGGGSAY
tara:strand:- start:75 stop:869 length:795 start_codon:yes stop_codon:yes gene_type:complete